MPSATPQQLQPNNEADTATVLAQFEHVPVWTSLDNLDGLSPAERAELAEYLRMLDLCARAHDDDAALLASYRQRLLLRIN
jgi:hypothetical protein